MRNRRDDLLFYARNLTDQRVHRIVGKCIAESGRQITATEPEPTTPSIRTELAADLLVLPDELITVLRDLVVSANAMNSEALNAAHLLVNLHPVYVHAVKEFAQSLYDAQTAAMPQHEDGSAVERHIASTEGER